MRALTTAATGMKAQEHNLNTIAHNLANVNTAGFKKSEVNFEDMLYVDVRASGVSAGDGVSAAGFQVGSGAAAVSNIQLHSQGTIEQTENPLHIAIDGEGYFEIQGSDGRSYYTRAGAFRRDGDGTIVNNEGLQLGAGISITDGIDQVSIGGNGQVMGRSAADGTWSLLGTIQLHRFMNPAGLRPRGGNLYEETPASGSPASGDPASDGMGQLKAGYVERSNVDVVGELIKMIMAQRAYEVNSRSIKAGDEMMSMATRLGRS
jgi:flagellar basal-body rod protein FlgG